MDISYSLTFFFLDDDNEGEPREDEDGIKNSEEPDEIIEALEEDENE